MGESATNDSLSPSGGNSGSGGFAQLLSIVMSAMDAVISVDETQNIFLFNPAAEKMFGWTGAEIVGEPLARLIPIRFHEVHRAHIQDFGASGVTTRAMGKLGTLKGVRKDGTEFPVEASISQVQVGPEKIYTVIVRDITERQRGEESLLRLAAIVNTSQDAIISKTLDGTIVSWNPGAEALYGYSEAEAIGKPIAMLFPPELLSESETILGKVRRGEKVEHYETVRLRQDGTRVNVSVSVSPIVDTRGRVIAASTIARDITHRIHVEQQLRYQANLIENVSDAIISTDLNGVITSWNRGAEEIYGWRSDEVLGKRAQEIFQTEISEAGRRGYIQQLIKEGSWQSQVVQKKRDGTRISITSSASLLSNTAGAPIGVVAVNRDITESLQAAEKLRYQANLIENISDAIFSIDKNDVIQSWNKGAEDMYGWTAAEALGNSVTQLLEVEFRHALRQNVLAKVWSEGHWRGEVVHTRKDGGQIHEMTTSALLKDTTGAPIGIVVVARDITEQKRAQVLLQESAARTLGLSELSKALVATGTDLRQILQITVEQIALSLGDICYVALVSEDREWVDMVAIHHQDPAVKKDLSLPRYKLGEGPFGKVVLSGEATLEAAVEPIPPQDLKPEHREFLTRHSIYSRLIVPMRIQNEIIGAVGVSRTRPAHTYTEDDKVYLQEMASRTALAISNVQAHVSLQQELTLRRQVEQELREQAARLTVLAQVSRLLAESQTDLQGVLERVATETAQVLECGCVIRLVDADRKHLIPVVTYHPNLEVNEFVREILGSLSIRTDDENPTARVFRSGESVLVPVVDMAQFRETLSPPFREFFDRFGLHSVILVPLFSVNRTIGVLGLTRHFDTPRAFGDKDLRLAQDIADRASLAISNARLFEQVGEELQERVNAGQEIRRLNEELEQRVTERTTQLEDAIRELEAFSYSVSHDLRAPLRSIDGFSQILMRDNLNDLPPKAQRHLQVIRASTQQMGQLIDDLLAFSRLSRHELKTQTIDMNALVRQVLRELETERVGRSVEILMGELAPCHADPALVKQVWVNLLSNALKYTRLRDPARIEIGSRVGDTECIYYVRDNGVGFDMRYYHKLFGVFQRLHRAEDYEGTGVGLAIVQRVVRRHNGKVWAEGQTDEGAAFYFTLQR